MVEIVMVAMLVVPLFLGVLQVGLFLYVRNTITAAASEGAHYADLTGEIPFVKEVIDALDARAAHAGVKVVQVCGFEALPADIAVLLATEAARERWGEALAEVDLEVTVTGPVFPSQQRGRFVVIR